MAYKNKVDAIKRLREKEKQFPDREFLIVFDPFDEDGNENITPYYVISSHYYYTPECEGGPCFSGSEIVLSE